MSSAMAPSISLSSAPLPLPAGAAVVAGAGVEEAVDEAVVLVVVVEPDACLAGLALPCEMLFAAPRTRFVKPILALCLCSCSVYGVARARSERRSCRNLEPRFPRPRANVTRTERASEVGLVSLQVYGPKHACQKSVKGFALLSTQS